MVEYFTEGIVLSKEKRSDFDGVVNVYTKDFGRISAKAKGIFRPISKLSGHLEPLNLVNVRVIEKNGFQITDALMVKKLLSPQAKTSINFYRQALGLLSFVSEMTFDFQPDIKLWQTILKTLEAINRKRTPSYSLILEALGFSPKFSQCQKCKAKPVRYFFKKDQVFYCSKCTSKIPKEELVLV